MKVITLLNEKGGVGKTTLATHIASGLALKGHRVVLVDADAQGSATYALGFEYEAGLYDLLVRKKPFKDVLRFVNPEIYEIPGQKVTGQLFLLPSNTETRNIANSINDALAVMRRFSELRTAVDFIIFDTSPTPSLLHGSIYLATDGILYPTKLEAMSFQGLVNSFAHREESAPYRKQFGLKEIENYGIVPTMYRQKTLEHTENLGELRASYGDLVWEPITVSTIWTESSRLNRTVWNIAPTSKPAAIGLGMVDRLLKVVEHEH